MQDWKSVGLEIQYNTKLSDALTASIMRAVGRAHKELFRCPAGWWGELISYLLHYKYQISSYQVLTFTFYNLGLTLFVQTLNNICRQKLYIVQSNKTGHSKILS